MRILFIIIFLMSFGSGLLIAQQGNSFLKAIQQYEKESDIKFSYDPSIIESVSRNFDNPTNLAQFIADVEDLLPFQITKISDTYYTISTVESQFSLTLSDSLEATPITAPFFLLVNSEPITMSVENDQAIFTYKPNLSDELILYAPGYDKRVVPVATLINQKDLSFALMTQTFLLNDVLVEDYVTKGINLDPANQNITIEVKNLPLLPGETDGDIFASLAALPGVTTPDGRPGNLFIRGNPVDQSFILYDNIPIYHRGHYFGTISPYNPKVVDNVEVYRSGYHPRMGGRVGGAVFINSDKNVTDKPKYGFGMNTLFAMAYGKTPLAKGKLGLVFGARHSYPTSVRSPKLNAITESVFAATGLVDENGQIGTDVDVKFQDYHVKLIAQPNDKNRISATGIYSNSDLKYKLIQGISVGQVEGINFENYGVNTEWQHKINNQWSASLINSFGNYTYFSGSPTPTGELKAENKIQDYNARVEVSNSSQQTHEIQLGVDYKWQSSHLDYFNITSTMNGPGEEFTKNETINAHTVSPFTNLNWFGEKYNVQLGLRGSYYSPRKAFYLDPRISANYTVNSLLDLKASAGRYHQFLSQVRNLQIGVGGFDNAQWALTSADEGNVISGSQYMAGFMLNKNKWLFDAEIFYKTANDVTYYESLFYNSNSDFFTADNVLYGLDTYIKTSLGEYTSAWLGYSYGDSKITLDTTSQVTYKSKYVQPHVFYIGSAIQKNRWKFSAVWKYGSGLNAQSLEIAYVQVVYERAQENLPPGVPRQPDPFENVPERYPNVHSLDLSASYTIPHTEQKPWSASFGLSIINVYDKDNLIDKAFRGNPPPPEFVDRNALGFAPNLMVIIEW